jgi:DNA-binding GntR family transcriptional regulator
MVFTDKKQSDARRTRRASNAAPARPDRARTARTQTLAEIQYHQLLGRITSMELPPGSAISDADIAQQAGISRTPVREAVQQLAREGLIDVVPKSGTFVSRIPVSALPEAVLARRALEGMTARVAASQATASQILTLRSILEEHRECKAAEDKDAFHTSDERFHETIAVIAGLPGLWRLVQQAKLQLDRFRRLTLPQEGRLSLVIEEHTAVVDAMELADPDGAETAMIAHISGLHLNIATIMEAHPDLFWIDCDPDRLLHV